MSATNITTLVLIALAVVLGVSLLAVAITPAVVYAQRPPPEIILNPSCDKDFGNPALHNPNCGLG